MKRRILFISIATLVTVVLAVGFNNCSQVNFGQQQQSKYGGIGGNPLTSTLASQEILFAICSVLDRCAAKVPFDVCMSGVLNVNGIGTRLGLPSGTNDPFRLLNQLNKVANSLPTLLRQTLALVRSIT